MKKHIISNKIMAFLLAIALTGGFWGCGEMLDDPTIDKETGEDISLVVVDFNFFTTRFTFKILDAETQTPITKQARIWFTGQNADDIVNFAGEKHSEYTSTQGQLELTVDPNIQISENTPFACAVHVEVDGYAPFSQGIQISTTGKKTFELPLDKESAATDTTLTGNEGDGGIVFGFAGSTKSAKIQSEEQEYAIRYYLSWEDILQFVGSNNQPLFQSIEEAKAAFAQNRNNFIYISIRKHIGSKTKVDRMHLESGSRMVEIQKLERGSIESIVVLGQPVTNLGGGKLIQTAVFKGDNEPDAFGFANFIDDGWKVLGVTREYQQLPQKYLLLKASLEEVISEGTKITFKSSVKSTFSIDADIYNADDKLIKSVNFKGKFPETFSIENVPQTAARIVFRNNNPAFKPIEPIEVENLCCGNYEVNVEPQTGYQEYRIIFKITCPDDRSVVIAPTYSGEYRQAGSDQPWQGIDMVGGVIDMLALPNTEYDIRLLWEDKYESASFTTNIEEYANQLAKYNATVTSKTLEDGRIQFTILHEFDQSICNDLDW